MRIFASVSKIKLNEGRLVKAVLELVDDIMYQGIKAFGDAASKAVPMDTGMARGSFLSIRAFLETKGYTLSTPIPEEALVIRSPYIHADGEIWNKEPYSGLALSTPSDAIYKRTRGNAHFTFESRVVHLNINDMYASTDIRSPDEVSRNWSKHKRPWRSFEAGQKAYIEAIKKAKPSAAKIRQFFTETSVTAGRESRFPELFRIRVRKIL